ncbi:MAG: MFS transporter [Burkholderiaceae bacterium]
MALATGLDYFDNAIFSFFVGYIAAGLHASPDELVWSSSAYAAAAVLGILQQQWWVEHAGYRRYIAGSLLLYALGALLSASCDTPLELAFARGVQGYFIGPMMGACRILIQRRYTGDERSGAIRTFLALIIVGSALAPLIGGSLVARFGWRALFGCTVLPAIAFAGFALAILPKSVNAERRERRPLHFRAYLLFAFSQGMLQIAMQQVRVEHPLDVSLLILSAAAGVFALAWFVRHQWRHPAPLVRLHALREATFRTGLALYAFYYCLATVFSFLTARLLEEGLGYPVEHAGQFVGGLALVSTGALFVYFRYAKLLPHKKWIIVPGFAIAALAAAWMSSVAPDADRSALVGPLLLRGLLLLFIVLPVGNVTFRIFDIEEFGHGYRLKNIVRQMTISFATAAMILFERHRFVLHQTQLGGLADPEALTRQAGFLAAVDGFHVLVGVAICGGIFAMLQKRVD